MNRANRFVRSPKVAEYVQRAARGRYCLGPAIYRTRLRTNRWMPDSFDGALLSGVLSYLEASGSRQSPPRRPRMTLRPGGLLSTERLCRARTSTTRKRRTTHHRRFT